LRRFEVLHVDEFGDVLVENMRVCAITDPYRSHQCTLTTLGTGYFSATEIPREGAWSVRVEGDHSQSVTGRTWVKVGDERFIWMRVPPVAVDSGAPSPPFSAAIRYGRRNTAAISGLEAHLELYADDGSPFETIASTTTVDGFAIFDGLSFSALGDQLVRVAAEGVEPSPWQTVSVRDAGPRLHFVDPPPAIVESDHTWPEFTVARLDGQPITELPSVGGTGSVLDLSSASIAIVGSHAVIRGVRATEPGVVVLRVGGDAFLAVTMAVAISGSDGAGEPRAPAVEADPDALLQGNGHAGNLAVSANGESVVFWSEATNLTEDRQPGLFRYRMSTDRLDQLWYGDPSITSRPAVSNDQSVFFPVGGILHEWRAGWDEGRPLLAADECVVGGNLFVDNVGTRLAFTESSGLYPDCLVIDLATSEIEPLADILEDHEFAESCRVMDMTPDGRFLAFKQSRICYVADMDELTTFPVNASETGGYLGSCWDLAVSHDGGLVAFTGSGAGFPWGNLEEPQLGVFDRADGSYEKPFVSYYGNQSVFAWTGYGEVLFEGPGSLVGGYFQLENVFLWDESTRNITSDIYGNGFRNAASRNVYADISAWRDTIGVVSDGINTVPGDGNMFADLFVSTDGGQTLRQVTSTLSSPLPNTGTRHPILSATGHTVAFFSESTNLGPDASYGVDGFAQGPSSTVVASRGLTDGIGEVETIALSADGTTLLSRAPQIHVELPFEFGDSYLGAPIVRTGVNSGETEGIWHTEFYNFSPAGLSATARYLVVDGPAVGRVDMDCGMSSECLDYSVRNPTGATIASWETAISGDGSLIAFTSSDAALGLGDDRIERVFLADVARDYVRSASVDNRGERLAQESGGPLISLSGGHVVFATTSHAFVYDVTLGTSTSYAAPADHDERSRLELLSVSADGRFVTTSSALLDVSAGRWHEVDFDLGARGTELGTHLVISADSRILAFEIEGALTAEDTNGAADIVAIPNPWLD